MAVLQRKHTNFTQGLVAHVVACMLNVQAWQPIPQSPFLVTGGKDGRVLVYDISEYAEPPPEAPEIPNLAAPTAVAPDPDLRDEVTAVCWSAVDSKLLYAAHASGEHYSDAVVTVLQGHHCCREGCRQGHLVGL
jgi:hypothetical protein